MPLWRHSPTMKPLGPAASRSIYRSSVTNSPGPTRCASPSGRFLPLSEGCASSHIAPIPRARLSNHATKEGPTSAEWLATAEIIDGDVCRELPQRVGAKSKHLLRVRRARVGREERGAPPPGCRLVVGCVEGHCASRLLPAVTESLEPIRAGLRRKGVSRDDVSCNPGAYPWA